MTKVDLAYIGHPILRKKAFPVHSLDQPILDLIRHMKETITAHHGLGLAAPQVGVQLAILIACFPEKSPSGEMILGAPKAFINPKISEHSAESWDEEEGCLSIPKIYANVRRPVSITVTYQDEAGKTHTERLSGWPAKIVMHENDHLNGVLFIDRLESKDKKEIAHDLERLKKHYKVQNEHLKLWKVPVQGNCPTN
jgi:peptide deformylase